MTLEREQGIRFKGSVRWFSAKVPDSLLLMIVAKICYQI